MTRVETISPADNRYRTFLALRGDGIARMELDEPLDVAAAEDRASFLEDRYEAEWS